MKDKIFIRVDGGASTGLGHLVRSMALAEMLKEKYKFDFFCREAPESIAEKIKAAGFGFIRITDEEEFFERAKVIVVILDGYEFKTEYQKRLKDQECTVVCIDDMHEGEFFADLIINHAPGIKPNDYIAQPYTKFALGLEYALLRPAFLEAAKLKKVPRPSENLFICFGGADPENLTLKALKAASNLDCFKKINVVTGASYLHGETLKEYSNEKISFHSDLDENAMCSIMLECDVAVVPSSSILLESIACGLKVVTCYYVDNQKDFHTEIVKLGIKTVGKVDEDYKERLKHILTDIHDFSTNNSKKNFVGVDGRVVLKIKSL